MPILQSQSSYQERFPQSILARTEGLRAPQHVEIDYRIYKDRVYPPGLFVGTTANTRIFRFLPRTRFKSVTGNVMTVSRWTSGIFVPGDVINVIDLATGNAGAAVGTVLDVDFDLDTVTFTAAPTAPAVNTVIGVAASKPITPDGNRLGIVSPNTIIDFTDAPNSQFGVFLGGVIHRRLIPHIDQQLENLFPQLDFVSP